jgi:endonuclease YncB( thermonuclease family)
MCTRRILSKATDAIPVFSLENYKGYAKVTDVYDGDTFKACILLHGRVKKFIFRTLGYDAPEMKPPLAMCDRKDHIVKAVEARKLFMHLLGFDEDGNYPPWNPFMCRWKINGWVWIECGKNDKYGRTLVRVYKNRKCVNEQMLESGYVKAYDGGTRS